MLKEAREKCMYEEKQTKKNYFSVPATEGGREKVAPPSPLLMTEEKKSVQKRYRVLKSREEKNGVS